jgi:ribosomal protein S18 acetylase RimI-like enzyme
MKISKAALKNQRDISDLYKKFHPTRNYRILRPLERFNAKNIVLIAEENKKIIGFVCSALIDYDFYKYGYIEELFVERSFRKKGVGTSLIKSTVNEMRKMGANTIFVTTKKGNRGAIRLYKNLGFTDDKKNKWFFQNL